MSNIAIQGAATGTGVFTIASPNSNTDRVITLPDEAGTVLTSGGAIDVDASAPADSVVIDSSGNLLVGKTSLGAVGAGSGFGASGVNYMTADGAATLRLNRETSDGDIVSLRKNNTVVGSISADSNDLVIGTGIAGLRFFDSGSSVIPRNSDGSQADNVLDIGHINHRWDDVYATNGTIQTSDRNEKQDIEELSEAEARVAVAAKGLLRKFRWRDAVTEKGDDARIHFGIIAQDLQAAFAAEGLDAGRYAMFISSTWWEATETYTDDDGVEQTRINTYETQEEAPQGATQRTRLGVRYPELLAFIIAAI